MKTAIRQRAAFKKVNTVSTFVLSVLFVLTGCSSTRSEYIPVKPNHDLLLIAQTDSSSVWATEEDRQTAQDVLAGLQEHSGEVCSALQTGCRFDVVIEIYTDQASFDEHIMNPEMRGFFAISGTPNTIQMVSPASPAPHEISYKDGVLVAVHEFVHLALDEINLELPVWLDEGVAVYMGPHEAYRVVRQLAFPFELTPSFQQLQDEYNSIQAPDLFAYTAVDFIVHEYGMEKLNSLLRAPQDFEHILGVSKETFQDRWHRFMSNQYHH